MTREDHRKRMAELFAADQVKRAQAEPEIARKEAELARERAKLARLQDEAAELETELEAARQAAAEETDPPKA